MRRGQECLRSFVQRWNPHENHTETQRKTRIGNHGSTQINMDKSRGQNRWKQHKWQVFFYPCLSVLICGSLTCFSDHLP